MSQADSTAEMEIDVHARYFVKGYFVYASAPNMDTDLLSVGFGKLFTFHRGVYVDPKVVLTKFWEFNAKVGRTFCQWLMLEPDLDVQL